MCLSLTMREAGVYIHVPFCASKCCYCDFLSFSFKEHLYEDYVSNLLVEINESNIKKVTTVYIGGGTPTVLPMNLLQRILSCVCDLPLTCDSEISIEINPGTVNKNYLQLLKSAGVNRLSFGLQSTNDEMLSKIGRLHSFDQFLDNYLSARDIGFGNISVDLMFSLPGQCTESFMESLSLILDLEPEHVSFYSLTPCENTPLWNDLALGKISLPDDAIDRNMYHFASKLFASQGYLHYEISNAAKRGYECTHNINCWLHNPYIGFGLGAHSFDGRRRWSNPSTFDDYFSRVRPDVEFLSTEELMSEAMILGLRLLVGVDELVFESRYGIKPSVLYDKQIFRLASDGLVMIDNNHIRLTKHGLDLANQVFMQFL